MQYPVGKDMPAFGVGPLHGILTNQAYGLGICRYGVRNARTKELNDPESVVEITVPTIVLCGSKDQTTPPWQSERLAAGIPEAQGWWVPRAGHMLNWEATDAIVEAVAELSKPR